MHWVYLEVQRFLLRWGYWAVLGGLLGEDAGLPLPGETVLMFASFLAHKRAELHIEWVVLIGIVASTTGDNIGFLLGRVLGDRFLRLLRKIARMDEEDIGAAKIQMKRHGKATIFWARFVFGLRTIAGPMAGVLGMEWREFALYNALGACTWITVIAMAGFGFAAEFQTLLSFFEKVSWAMGAGLLAIGYLLWRRQKKRYKARLRARRRAQGEA